jgi:tetratricopeptide (TPR) repeat protein
VPAATPLYAPPRRGIALLGIGMGLAIVAVAVVGVKLLRGPKATPAPTPVATEVAKAPPAPEVVAPAPPPAAPAAKAPPAQPVVARRASRAEAEPAAEESSTSRHHHHHHHHARQAAVAVKEPAAKPAPKPVAATPAEHGDPRPHYERGNALLFAGDSKAAIGAYREAIRTAPNDPSAYRGLGLAYEQQGDTTAAARALRRYLKLSPDAADRDMVSKRIDRLSHKAKR